MSREVPTAPILRIPAGRFVWSGLVGLLVLALPTALLASSIPTSYQGASKSLPIGLSSSYLLQDVAVDAAGTVYILDSAGNQVLVENQDYLGLASVAASGPPNYPGNLPSVIGCAGVGGFNGPKGMTIQGGGILYVADTGNSRVVSVNLSTRVCSVVGMGTGSTVVLSTPQSVAVSEYGDVYISDSTAGPGGHGMIVRIPYGGVALDLLDESTTIAGNTYQCPPLLPCGYGNLGVPYTTPVVVNGVWNPKHIAWDNYDDMLFIADYGNSRILAFNEQWVSGNGGLPWEIETDGAWNFPQNLPGSNSQLP